MPPLARWLVRVSFLHLALGATAGALLLTAKAGVLPRGLFRLLPGHLELLLVGWPVPLAMGVAYWILPRLPQGGRGRPAAAVASLALLVSGVWLAVAGAAPGTPAGLLVAGRLAEAAAAATFAWHAWPRVRAALP